jgi:signal transduction histidine kinase
MLMQAGAGRRVLDQAPDKTRELLLDLEQAGRDALAELDRVLGVLRADDPDGGLPSGAPGLAVLPDLAQRMTQAGLRVGVRVDPDMPPLPRSLDLSAYRVVQESLTNAFKHGEARTASVMVSHDGVALGIEVRNDGHGPRPGYVPGRGLLGIGERVALFGGSVEHGAGERGGFWVRARLPLPERPDEPAAGGTAR